MKEVISIICIILFCSCSASKKGKEQHQVGSDSSFNNKGNVQYHKPDKTLPGCILNLINQFKAEEKQNPPRMIYRYQYKGREVYYVPPVCCDFYSDLYDSTCTIIAHPDGGYTGRGDGSAADFISTRTEEQLIWKDER